MSHSQNPILAACMTRRSRASAVSKAAGARTDNPAQGRVGSSAVWPGCPDISNDSAIQRRNPFEAFARSAFHKHAEPLPARTTKILATANRILAVETRLLATFSTYL